MKIYQHWSIKKTLYFANIKMPWSGEIEALIKQFSEKSQCYRMLHFNSYSYYKSLDTKFSLPCIILSVLAGASNLGSSNFPTYARMIVIGSAIVNILTSIIGTTQRFLNTSELQSLHYTSSIEFGKLSRNLQVMLALPREERNVDALTFLENTSNEYNRILDGASPVPGWILKKFEKRFQNIDVAKPDLITLVPVKISSVKNKIPSAPTSVVKYANVKKEKELELNQLRESGVVRKQSVMNLGDLHVDDDDEDIETGSIGSSHLEVKKKLITAQG